MGGIHLKFMQIKWGEEQDHPEFKDKRAWGRTASQRNGDMGTKNVERERGRKTQHTQSLIPKLTAGEGRTRQNASGFPYL